MPWCNMSAYNFAIKIRYIRNKTPRIETGFLPINKRKQAVLCHNELLCFVAGGVPQGSILGPFLFLLFNDISQFTTDGCLTNQYADDTMIYLSVDNIHEVQQKLQQCVKKICSWYKINRLKINIDKT